jgi:eukaryotic-like serine/threonine-protein kinase
MPTDTETNDTGPVGGPPTSLTRPVMPDDSEPRTRLATRLAASTAALLAAALGLALVFATFRADAVTSRKIEENLQSVPSIYQAFENAEAVSRRQQVGSLAEQAGTKALLAEAAASPETLHDSARDFAQNLGAGIVFFFDGRGALLTRSDRATGEEAGRDFSAVSWVHGPLANGNDTWAYILDVKGTRMLYLVAAAPVTQGEGPESRLLGVVAAAFAVDNRRAEALGHLLSGEAAFLANVAPRGAPPEVAVVASTPSLRDVPFQDRLKAAQALERVFQAGQPWPKLELAAATGDYIGTVLPIKSGSGEPIGALVVARSKAAELATFHEIRRALLGTAVLVLLLSLPVSIGLARHISRPIERLAEAAHAIRRGELEGVLTKLPSVGRDEIGVLARAFAAMVQELREKAALEAWVAEILRRPGDVTVAGREVSLAQAALPGDLVPGRLFAKRYQVLSILGQGGMGTVFRVRDRELEEDVALKVLRAEVLGEGAQAVQALKQEIRVARMITHPNVVRVHDLGESDSVRFLTMEYVAGTTLGELLDRLGPLDLAPGLQIAKQICRGLTAVHQAGVVHGDLKPRNIMVMANGVVKLMDFGVAHSLHMGPHALDGGSPHYMSPEQVRGGEVDARCDLYAAGVTLYEMFTGRRPFEADDMDTLLRMHLNEAPVPPRRHRPDMPEALESAVLACLEKSRIKRTPSAADLERALLRVRV